MAVEKPVLTQEQQDAVAALASTNVYAKQSKFKTFRELPPKDKWPYFKQNFLTDVLIIGTCFRHLVCDQRSRGRAES